MHFQNIKKNASLVKLKCSNLFQFEKISEINMQQTFYVTLSGDPPVHFEWKTACESSKISPGEY